MGRVIHFEIHCGDVDRAEGFYAGLFGWQVQRIGGPLDYRLLITGPDGQPGIDGALMQRQGEVDGQAVIGYVNTIQVDDLQRMEQAIPAAGGEQVAPRIEVPDVGHVAYFKDTEGNVFGALQPMAMGNVD